MRNQMLRFTYLLVIALCATNSSLRTPLSMRELVVKDAHNQEIVTVSAIDENDDIIELTIKGAFDNGIAHRFWHLKCGE